MSDSTLRVAGTQTAGDDRSLTTAQAVQPPRFTAAQIGQAALLLVMVLYSIFSLAPFLFSIFSSFKTNTEALANPPTFFPQHPTLDAYKEIFQTTNTSSFNFPRYFLNSLGYAGGVTILNVLLASMAGYAFGRLEFFGKNVIFSIMLAVMMIPGQLIMIPKFLIANSLGLTDNLLGLIIPGMVTPTAVFLMTQFMKTLPKELEESAMIDGSNRWTAFWRVIFPLTQPALTAVAIFSFQGAWNDFLWPLLVMSSRDNYTMTVGLAFFKGNHYTEYALMLAGSTINILPLVVIFFIFQRYFIKGVSTSGLAGR